MEDYQQARVLDVAQHKAKSETSANVAVNATQLPLYSVGPFNETGGQVRFGNVVYNYLSKTETEPGGYLTLAAPLPVATEVDTEVYAYPISNSKSALCQIDEEDPVLARVPRSMYATLAEMVRDGFEQESVLVYFDGSEWVVHDVIADEYIFDGGYIDPSTLPEGPKQWTWVKYADGPNGEGLSDSPAGKDYIGLAPNQPTELEGTDPSAYQWTYFRGPEGEQGVPGGVGDDGQQLYIWIKYADDINGNGMAQQPNGKDYIGFAYNKTTPTESDVKTDYTWGLFRGPKGVEGAPGDKGDKGDKGDTGAAAATITLTATTQVLTQPATGGATNPATSVITPTTTNTTITAVSYSINGGSFVTTPPAGVSRNTTTNVVTITGVNLPAGTRTVTVRMADAAGISDTLTVAEIIDGAQGQDANSIVLSNEAQSFAGSTTAAIGETVTTEVIAFRGTTRQSVSVQSITGAVTGITALVNSGTNSTTAPIITITTTSALVQRSGVLTITLVVNGQTYTKTFSWTVSRQGDKGDTGTPGGTVSATTTAQALVVPAAGGATNPTTSTITGSAVNTTISSITYSVNGGSYTTTVPTGASVNGLVVTITGASLPSSTRSIGVRFADAVGNADSVTVVKVVDGAPGGVGDRGPAGRGIALVSTFYARVLHTSAAPDKPTTSTPPSPWVSTEPAYVLNTDLYRVDRIGYSDGTFEYTTPVPSSTYEAIAQVQSRGIQLVVNGNGSLRDNTNFPGTTFKGDDAPTGAVGSFWAAGTQVISDQAFPVDPEKVYEISAAHRQVAGAGNWYLFFAPYDAYGLAIVPTDYMAQAGTLTTLAADLKPGDTTVSLTSASGWSNAAGASTHLRTLLFWDYVDPGGKAWPENTYSKNWYRDVYADGAISGNTITLRTAWTGPLKPAGTKLSNGSAGGTYMYSGAVNITGTSDWTSVSGRTTRGIHPGGTPANATTKFPAATALSKVGFLLNYAVPGQARDTTSRQSFANVSVTEITAAQVAADQSIQSYVTQYAVNTSETVPPNATTGGWSTSTPTRTPGSFIWVRTIVTRGNGSISQTSPALMTGNQGEQGEQGEDAYTVVLTNEAQSFAGSTSAALAASTTTQVIAYKAAELRPATIGTVTGAPTGMSTSITNNGTTSATLTVSVTTSLTATSGTLTLPVTVDGISFTKTFSFSVSRQGTAGLDAYTVLLSNEAQSFPGTATAATGGTPTTTEIIAYKGSTRVSATVGTISGAVTGISAAVNSGTNGTTAPVITITPTSSLTALNGTFTIPVTVDGQTFTKTFSWTVSRAGAAGGNGAPGGTVSAVATSQVLTQPAAGGATSPATATITGSAVNTTITSVTYSVNGGAYSTTLPTGASISGNVVTVTGASMPSSTRSISVRFADAAGNADSATIARVVDGATGAAGATVSVVATSQAMAVSANGTTITPTSVTMTGTSVGSTISVWEYSVNGAAYSSSTVPAGVSRSGNVVTITGSSMTARSIGVRMADSLGNADSTTVMKLNDGSAGLDAYTIVLGNEAQVFPGTQTAAVASSTVSTVVAYKGSTRMNATIGSITGMPTGMSVSIQNNASTTSQFTVAVTTAMVSLSGVLNVPVTVDGVTFNKTFSWSLGRSGPPGDKGDKGDQGADPGPSAPPPAMTVDVTGLSNAFILTARGNIDQYSTIDYYMNNTLIKSTRSTIHSVWSLPNGNPLVENETYSFYIVVRNALGSSAPSATETAELNPALTSTQVAAIVEAGFVLTETIEVGNIKIKAPKGVPGDQDYDPGGIIIPRADGTSIVLPADSSDPVIDAILRTEDLIVSGGLVVNGQNNYINGRLLLAAGTPDPRQVVDLEFTGFGPNSPVMSFGGLAGQGTTLRGLAVTTNGHRAFIYGDGSSNDRRQLRIYNPDNTLRATVSGDSQDLHMRSVCAHGNQLHVVGLRYNSTVDRYQGLVFSYDLDGTRLSAGWMSDTSGNRVPMDQGDYTDGAIASDGTWIFVARINSQRNVLIYRFNPGEANALAQFPLTGRNSTYLSGGMYVGNADFGARRFVLQGTFGGTTTYSTGVWDNNGTFIPSQSWATGGWWPGLAWSGGRFLFVWKDANYGFRVYEHNTNVLSEPLYATYTWYDNNAAGGNKQTKPAPPLSYTLPSREYLQINLPAPPISGSGEDDPNSVRVYTGPTAADLRQRLTYATGAPGSTLLVPPYLASSSTPNALGSPPPTENTFGSTANLGEVASPNGVARISGDGSGRSGPLEWDTSSNLLRTPLPPGSIQMFAGAIAPAGFLFCDGSAVLRADYPKLFEVIGTTFGAGNGSTTFNLPDLVRRVPVGVGGGIVLGRNEGVANQASRTFAHNHSISSFSHNQSTNTTTGANASRLTSPVAHDHGGNTGTSSFNEIPSLALNYLIKT